MLQAGGTASGTIYKPDGTELYLDSVAMIKAYEIYRWVPTMPSRAGGLTVCDVTNQPPCLGSEIGQWGPPDSGVTVRPEVLGPPEDLGTDCAGTADFSVLAASRTFREGKCVFTVAQSAFPMVSTGGRAVRP